MTGPPHDALQKLSRIESGIVGHLEGDGLGDGSEVGQQLLQLFEVETGVGCASDGLSEGAPSSFSLVVQIRANKASSKRRSLLIEAPEIDNRLSSYFAQLYDTLLIILDLADVQNCSTNVVETTGLTVRA
ncbi:hypothetical protein Tco_0691572 [Tanacetum coccineum]